MAEDYGDKKHAPTQRRRKRARAEGRVVNSRDLTSAAVLLLAIAALWFFGRQATQSLAAMMTDSFASPQVTSFDSADAVATIARTAMRLAIIVAPLLLGLFATAILMSFTQTGFLFLPSKALPSLNNIDPTKGVQRIASAKSFFRLLHGIGNSVAVVAALILVIQSYTPRLMRMGEMDLPQVAQTIIDCVLGTCVWVGATLLGLAFVDYAIQRWRLEQELRMTDEELREELRELNGPAAVNDRRRERQRTSLRPRNDDVEGVIVLPTHQVSIADVIVTSPAGTVIALKYNPMTMNAPKVVAKGQGREGERLLAEANRCGIRTVQNTLLAEHQYREIGIGDEIPNVLYPAVARIFRSTAA